MASAYDLLLRCVIHKQVPPAIVSWLYWNSKDFRKSVTFLTTSTGSLSHGGYILVCLFDQASIRLISVWLKKFISASYWRFLMVLAHSQYLHILGGMALMIRMYTLPRSKRTKSVFWPIIIHLCQYM